eukprot:gnl/Chilomastix_cuspidata/5151.p1 GENE.gnl/Chilomastix_cuspidata/5151~~gnl/Chilomastix_cuspidata/5151.p1  ORF type:complete len:456 (+),score=123.70 gnl/Chilomastix_cuspidata/5151:262-1629(+)
MSKSAPVSQDANRVLEEERAAIFKLLRKYLLDRQISLNELAAQADHTSTYITPRISARARTLKTNPSTYNFKSQEERRQIAENNLLKSLSSSISGTAAATRMSVVGGTESPTLAARLQDLSECLRVLISRLRPRSAEEAQLGLAAPVECFPPKPPAPTPEREDARAPPISLHALQSAYVELQALSTAFFDARAPRRARPAPRRRTQKQPPAVSAAQKRAEDGKRFLRTSRPAPQPNPALELARTLRAPLVDESCRADAIAALEGQDPQLVLDPGAPNTPPAGEADADAAQRALLRETTALWREDLVYATPFFLTSAVVADRKEGVSDEVFGAWARRALSVAARVPIPPTLVPQVDSATGKTCYMDIEHGCILRDRPAVLRARKAIQARFRATHSVDDESGTVKKKLDTLELGIRATFRGLSERDLDSYEKCVTLVGEICPQYSNMFPHDAPGTAP